MILLKFEVTKINMNCLFFRYGTTLDMVGFQWCNSKDPLIVNLKVVLHCKHLAINLYKTILDTHLSMFLDLEHSLQ